MTDHLHIVCLDAPSPPDYGGAIDMYYKIVSLAESGAQIRLHYFDYNKKRGIIGLEKYCTEIHSYSRKSISFSSVTQPYITSSRINQQLIQRLNEDEHPVLLEGLHCSGLIPYLNKPSRIVVRMHNDEVEYYRRISSTESSLSRRLYFKAESILLKKYYRRLCRFDVNYACLSISDIFKMKEYGFKNLNFIPCLIPWQRIISMEGNGDYCLYHGNMKVAENDAAAAWLISIFRDTGIVLVIAGNDISPRLNKLSKKTSNIKLINDPSMEELDFLIRDAHINVLPSLNATGVKLKLLHALFSGRHCLCNSNAVKGSAVEELVCIADEVEEFKKQLVHLYQTPFTEEDKKNRSILLTVYDNKINASKISALY